MLIRRTLLAAALAVSSLAGGPAALADEASTLTWSVKPQQTKGEDAARPNFAFTVAPGDKVSDALVVHNYTDRPLDLAVTAADGIQKPDGTLDALLPDETSTGVGAWLEPEVDELRVRPGTDATVRFTITVPSNATPGDHVGALLTSQFSDARTGVAVDRRLGSRVRVRVDGPLAPQVMVEGVTAEHDGSALPFGRGAADVRYTIVNTGNTVARVRPEVRITGPFGTFRTTTAQEETELIPGARIELTARVDDVAPTVWACVTVGVDGTVVPSGETLPRATATTTLWPVPWTGLLALALVLTAAAGLRAQGARRRRREQQRIDEAVEAALSRADSDAD